MSNERSHLREIKDDELIQVKKPSKLDQCKSTLDPNIPNIETLVTALPHCKISDVNDWTRLHPNEMTYWSSEYCFTSVPVVGQKRDTLHLVFEDLAKRFLPSKIIKRFRLVLATKPHDVFFLCEVPTRNLDNAWNKTSLQACQQAKTRWVQATSRKGENAEGYFISYARDEDAFPNPSWPKQSLNELIEVSFNGRIIDVEDHPALLRLIGAKQSLA
jgi:hypothetical protein